MKKLTNTQLKAKKIPSVYPDSTKQQQAAAGTKPEMTIEPEVVPEVEEKTVKTSYGRQSKPVLVPIKTENVRCKHCQELFRSLYKLKQHMEKVHSDQLPEKLQPCQKVLPLGYVPAPLHGELLIRISMLRSAIFYHRLRPVVPGCARYAMAHPDFGRSVNSISTRGTDYAHLITTGTPGFSDLPTALIT